MKTQHSFFYIMYRDKRYELIDGFNDELVFIVEIKDIKKEYIGMFVEELKEIIEISMKDDSFLDYFHTPLKFINSEYCSKMDDKDWDEIYKIFRDVKKIFLNKNRVKWIDGIAGLRKKF